MAYQLGDVIEAEHFNKFNVGGEDGTFDPTDNSLERVWGTPNGIAYTDYGYGQTNGVSPVNIGETITAVRWSEMLNRIATVATHQGTTLTAIPNPSTGEIISVFDALAQNIVLINQNRLNAAQVGSVWENTSAWSDTWFQIFEHTWEIDFQTNDRYRAFFNSGGQVKFWYSKSGGSADAKNTNWQNLLSDVGTLVFSSARTGNEVSIAGTDYTGFMRLGGGGMPPSLYNTDAGVYDINESTWVFAQYGTGAPYNVNYVAVNARRDDSKLIVRTRLVDDETHHIDEQVTGTISFKCGIANPSTAYLSNVWGAPTLTGTRTYV